MSDTTLRKMGDTVARHRMEEAAELFDMGARLLKDVRTLVAPTNGLDSAIEQRYAEAMTLADTTRRNLKEYLRPKIDAVQTVDADHAKAVVAAKQAEGEAQP